MDFGIFQDQGSERANSISSSDLDPFLLQGDEQTWAAEDWNWDPFNMFAAPKETPNVACCQALKKRKVADNTATSAPQPLPNQQPAALPQCHGATLTSHRQGPPAAPAAACCIMGAASHPAATQHVTTQSQPTRATYLKLEPESIATGCRMQGMVAPTPVMPAPTPVAASGHMAGMAMGMGMGMGLAGNMGWPGMPNMGAAAAAAAAAASAPAFFANMATGRGPLAALGWGAMSMPGMAMPGFPAQCAPAMAMPASAFQDPSGVQLSHQTSLAMPHSSLPSPVLGSSGDTGSLQGSADNAKPHCCGEVRPCAGPTCSGGKQQSDSSNRGAAPPPANEGHAVYTSGRGGAAAGPGDLSDIAISDSEDDREDAAPRRGGRAPQQPQPHSHLAALADVVALQDMCDDTDNGVCQVPGCGKDLSNLKEYHQRYRICDVHIKLQQVMKDGRLQRFCQQCGRFHDLTAFDGNRKSCREQLSKHNARRRRRTGAEPVKGKAGSAAATAAQDATAAAAAVTAATAVNAGGLGDGDVNKLVSSLMSNPSQLHALKLLLGVPTHPALPAGQGAVEASADASASSDQARTYGLARDILAGRNEFAPSYVSEHRTVRLSMKLFNKTPADLPHDLRNQITSWLASSPATVEAAIRPGCVFLTVQMLLDEAGAAQAEAPGALDSLVEHLLNGSGAAFWREGFAALQLGGGEDMVMLRDGKRVGGASGYRDGRSPVVRRLGPLAALAGQPAVLRLHGEQLDAPDCTVIIRWGSRHIKLPLQPVSTHRAVVRLPPLPDVCGSVWVEVCRGSYMSPPKHLLVVRDPALVEEINKLDCREGPLDGESVEALVRDLALVLQHIGGEPGVAAQLPHAAIALKARRLLAIACDMGWAAVATAVLPLACTRCSCASDMVAAIHAASEVAPPPQDAFDAEDAADPRALSLLHRAVRGGSLALLSGMLAWGDSHGYRWPVDAAGPGGVTPLHLAALLAEPRVALMLLDHCGWAAAFTHLMSDGGVTPFHLAFQMGHYQVDALMAALGNLQPLGRDTKPQPDVKPATRGAAARQGRHKEGCPLLQPCEFCHCTLPPLLLSIHAFCSDCGRRRNCVPVDAAAAGRGGACACGGARPSLRSDLGELCSAQEHSSVFSITALCQGCHGDRVLAVA